MRPGTVLGIDRERRVVRARLDGVTEIEAEYLGDPPWPLATALFEGGPVWRCRGPLGNRRVVLHDDFTRVASPDYGDGPWRLVSTDFASPGTVAPAAGGALGAARLTAPITSPTGPASTATLIKDDSACALSAPPTALWCSFRIRSQDTLNATVLCGLRTNMLVGATPSTAHLYLGQPSTTREAEFTVDNGSGSPGFTLVGTLVANSQWIVCDIVVVADSFAAIWVDGNGPWVEDRVDRVPDEHDGMSPFLHVTKEDPAVVAWVDIDSYHLELVTPITQPVGSL